MWLGKVWEAKPEKRGCLTSVGVGGIVLCGGTGGVSCAHQKVICSMVLETDVLH